MRTTVNFNSNGTKCVAWLYQPDGDGPFPIIVMAHGLTGTKEMRLDAYAERFSKAGYACLVFDYRYFGGSEGDPRQLLDIKKQHQDWIAAIDYARLLPQVDIHKIVLWGSSLSGGHVLHIASLNPKVAAVISQVPHLSGLVSTLRNSFSKLIILTIHSLYDVARGKLGLTPHYVRAAGTPKQLAFMNAAGEFEKILKIIPEGHSYDNRVTARSAFDLALYSPIQVLSKLSMPFLVQVAENDLTTPAKPAINLCGKISNGTLIKYETGHFEPYVEPMFSTFIEDQLKFLNSKLM